MSRERKIDSKKRPYCRLLGDSCHSHICCANCPSLHTDKCVGCFRINTDEKTCPHGLTPKEYIWRRITDCWLPMDEV